MGTHDTATARKARGAYFTPAPIAAFIAQWAVRHPDDTILEPSCGEAGFLLAGLDRLRQLGNARPAGGQLVGMDLHPASVDAAVAMVRQVGGDAAIEVGDFFQMPVGRRYSAVIGNPPYVRYQSFSGAARRAAQLAALEQGVRLTGLSSSWAAFTVQAARHLADDGRMGLVLPAELLSVNYAAEVRGFLLRRFSRVRLVLFEKLVFPGAQEDVVLLLAEGRGQTDRFEVFQAKDAADLARVDTHVWASAHGDSGKWTSALLGAGAISQYQGVVGDPRFTTLGAWGRTYLGAVTGANHWFALSAQEVRDLGLTSTDVIAISPPGSRHLRGLTFTDAAWAELRDAGRKVYLFRPAGEPSPAARRRIRDGEAAGVHQAYKCRVRSPWWRVPLVPPPDLLLTYMNHDTPRLTANRAGAHHLNSVHGVTVSAGVRAASMDLLPLAALNSATLLGAEVVGRAYGGGMLKLEPREADALPLPAPATVKVIAPRLRALRPELEKDLREGDLLAATRKVDQVLLRQHLGLSAADIQGLRDARELLFTRRVTRARTSHDD